MERSKGHRAFIGEFEYYVTASGDLVRARVESTYIQPNGYRSGGRFEAPPHMVDLALRMAAESFEKYAA